jgi:transposase
MTKITFSPEDIQQLQQQRFYHPHPRVRIKMEVLWLKSKGLQDAKIEELASVSINTRLKYFREFQEGGIKRLQETRFYRPTSELDQHAEVVKKAFEGKPPVSTQEAQMTILNLTGISRSPTQTREFLKRLGMKFRKVGVIPSKVDIQKQEEFKKKH